MTASFDGHPYRGSIAVYGGQHVLGGQGVRRAIGKAGDVVEVELDLDEDERTVDIPVDVKNSLAAAGLGAQFDAMSYTKRRQAVERIESSKASTRGGAGSRSSFRSSARPIDAR